MYANEPMAQAAGMLQEASGYVAQAILTIDWVFKGNNTVSWESLDEIAKASLALQARLDYINKKVEKFGFFD